MLLDAVYQYCVLMLCIDAVYLPMPYCVIVWLLQSYDNLLASSIYQLSLKVKAQTDRILDQLKWVPRWNHESKGQCPVLLLSHDITRLMGDLKAALPLAERIEPVSYRCSKIGPMLQQDQWFSKDRIYRTVRVSNEQCLILVQVTTRQNLNSSPPGQNGCHFGRRQIPIRISLKFVPRSPIDNRPAMVPIMAWCRRGDKLLPEPVLT